MKPLVIAICVVVLGAVPAFGQVAAGGHIGLYSDSPGYADCYLAEALYATNSVYVVHKLIAEANTSQFKVDHDWGAIAGAVDYVGNLTLGNIYTGVTVTYVGCKPLPHVLARLDFTPIADTGLCGARFEVTADPGAASGQIVVVNCSSQERWATGGILYVNGTDNDCQCGVPTEETSWGKVKSLYR